MADATLQGADRGSLAEILKQNYSDSLVDQMVRKNWIATQLMKTARLVHLNEGREYVVPLWETGSPAGIHRGEWDASPTAYSQTVNLAKFNMATYQRTIQISGELMHGSAGNEAAILRALDFEVRGAIKDSRDDFATALWMPKSGSYGDVKTNNNSTTVVLADADHTKWLRVGDRVSVLKTADGLVGNGIVNATVSSITNESTFELGTATAGDTTSGYAVFKSSGTVASGAADTRHQQFDDNPYGLTDIISTIDPKDAGGTDDPYGQIDRDTNAFWKAQETDAGGGNEKPVSHEFMADMRERIETGSSGSPKWGVTTYKIWKDIVLLHSPMKVYDGTAIRANAWFEYVLLESVPVYRDRQCPPNQIYVVDDDSGFWEIAENRAIAWVDDQGDMLTKVSGKWGFDALLARMYQIVCSAPNAQGRIINIAEAAFSG